MFPSNYLTRRDMLTSAGTGFGAIALSSLLANDQLRAAVPTPDPRLPAPSGRPSLGAWVNYGLGTENGSLPAFVVMEDNPGHVVNGPRNWGAGFMPAVYQGTPLEAGDEPIKYLANPKDVSDERQRKKLELLAELNRRHAAERPEQSELQARIASYELAFKMQAEAPEAVDLSQH